MSEDYTVDEIEGGMYEVRGKWMTISPLDGVPNSGEIEAETEAEEEEEVDPNAISAIDVVYGNKWNEAFFDKTSYMVHMKEYIHKMAAYLEEHDPGRVDAFMVSVTGFVKTLLPDISQCRFFLGQASDASSSSPEDGMTIVMRYKPDAPATPFFYLFAHGVTLSSPS